MRLWSVGFGVWDTRATAFLNCFSMELRHQLRRETHPAVRNWPPWKGEEGMEKGGGRVHEPNPETLNPKP